MDYRIMIVEDDSSLAEGIATAIEKWHMHAECVTDFSDLLNFFSTVQSHLILMDIKLPYMDGYYWCREIRKISTVPIIFISSASENMNIVMAMNMGGDDFIAKPFDTSVLIAKIQALLRRTYDLSGTTPVLEHLGAVLNTGDQRLYFHDQTLDLSKNEYRILFVLMQQKGVIVSREKLITALWESDSFVDENTLTVNVGRLRKKLEGIGLHDFIQTKFGVGYMIGEQA